MCQATAKTKLFRCYCKQTRPIVAAEIVAFAAIKIIPDCIESLFDTGLENLFLFHSYRDNHLQTESSKDCSIVSATIVITTSLINFRGFF